MVTLQKKIVHHNTASCSLDDGDSELAMTRLEPLEEESVSINVFVQLQFADISKKVFQERLAEAKTDVKKNRLKISNLELKM